MLRLLACSPVPTVSPSSTSSRSQLTRYKGEFRTAGLIRRFAEMTTTQRSESISGEGKGSVKSTSKNACRSFGCPSLVTDSSSTVALLFFASVVL